VLQIDDLSFARRIIREQGEGLTRLADTLDESFADAVALIVSCANAGGNVLVSGLGKSGLIGAKISATLASVGIPSHAVHPSEAAHGDLGRFRNSDLALCISFSGETDEVVNLAAILRQDGLKIIAITGPGPGANGTSPALAASSAPTPTQTTTPTPTPPSTLERLATISLRLPIEREAGGPEFVAPTTSTTATLALGDALALVAARRRNFTSQDFARRHPGGSLGGLLRPVTEVMRWTAGKNLPLIDARHTVAVALEEASQVGRRPGAILLVDGSGVLAGIFTDADLRRLVLRDASKLHAPIAEVMTKSPRTLRDDALVRDAVRMVMEHRQDEVPVVDAPGRPVGMLDVQDLIAMRLVHE
jgi:arabinose-5-phosphate isomerase